jgi:ppGpp synthetase/RelA/SpoT-type nucleotidyltranferase
MEDTDEVKKVHLLLDQYSEKKPLFDEFTKTIAFLLENLLKKNNSQFQTIQYRTKEEAHFKEKLFRNKDLQGKLLFEMPDLSACRVIFYFEEDLYQFAEILHKEFNVVEDESKTTPNEYNARHISIKLKENRLSLTEYSKFKGLLCEIQLTIILYHAWSEIQHDVIYKPNKDLLYFDKPTFDYLDNYFKEIMEKHLKEASRGFSFIYYQFNRIKEGQVIVSPSTIDVISKSQSNIEIYNFLKVLNEHVGKYAHTLPKQYDLIQALETTLDSVEKNAIINTPTVFGTLKGISYVEIGDAILAILQRYYDVSGNLKLAIRLSKNESLRKKCEDVISQMVSYRVGVMEKYGLSVQKSVLNFITNQKPEYILENLDFILHSIRPMATFECHDLGMTNSNTVTFRQGCLKPTAALADIRKEYFKLTKKLYQLVTTDAEKRKVLEIQFCLASALHNGLTEEITSLLCEDITNIIDFLISKYNTISNTNKVTVQNFLHLTQRSPFINRVNKLSNLIDLMAHDSTFEKFRIFYGDDLHFYPDFDFEKAESFRLMMIDKYIKEIGLTCIDRWSLLFQELLASKEYSQYFSIFLRRLGEAKPDIGFKIAEDYILGPFLAPLQSGLIESKAGNEARKLVVKNSRSVETELASAQTLLSKIEYDDSFFKELFPNLFSSSEPSVLITVLQTITITYSKHRNHREEFTKLINKLSDLKCYLWSHIYFSSKDNKDFWQELSQENIKAITSNLKNCEYIEYPEE